MSDKIVKVESEVVASAPGALERALEETPAAVAPSSLRPGAEKVYRFLNGLSELRNINIGLRTTAGELISMRSILVVKPEILVEISNYMIARAQENCNETGREMKYIVTAYLNSNALNELLISLTPTDIVAEREQGQNKLEVLDDLPPPDDAFAILGEMLGKSGAFQEMIARRAASGPPIMRVQRTSKTRDYQIAFPTLRLKAGESAATVQRAQTYFRGEKLRCSVVKAGSIAEVDGVYINGIFVGNLRQQQTGPIASRFFSANALGGGVKYDTAQPGIDITLTVRNTNNFEVVFDAVMFGRAVV